MPLGAADKIAQDHQDSQRDPESQSASSQRSLVDGAATQADQTETWDSESSQSAALEASAAALTSLFEL